SRTCACAPMADAWRGDWPWEPRGRSDRERGCDRVRPGCAVRIATILEASGLAGPRAPADRQPADGYRHRGPQIGSRREHTVIEPPGTATSYRNEFGRGGGLGRRTHTKKPSRLRGRVPGDDGCRRERAAGRFYS